MIEEGVVEEKGGGGGGRDGIKLSERRGLKLTMTAEEYLSGFGDTASTLSHSSRRLSGVLVCLSENR